MSPDTIEFFMARSHVDSSKTVGDGLKSYWVSQVEGVVSSVLSTFAAALKASTHCGVLYGR